MSRFLYVSILAVSFCILSVTGCKKNIDKEIRDFVASSVVVPYDKFDKRICSHFTDTLSATKDYRLVCYLDSSECQTCKFSQLVNMEKEHINMPEYQDLEFLYIFNVGKDDTEALYRSLCRSRIEGIVYFDTLNVFMKNNPHIPQENIYHTFVIDKKGKVLLVGNPFQNDRMTALLNKILVSKK